MRKNPFVVVSLFNLPSLDQKGLESLNELGVFSIAQLLQFGPLESATVLSRWAQKKIKHDIDLTHYLDGDISNINPENVLGLGLKRLRGVSERVYKTLEKGFDIHLIQDLLSLSIVSEARNILQFVDFYERPSAPDYLVPKPRERSGLRYRYKSWTRIKRMYLQDASLKWQPDEPAFFRLQMHRAFFLRKGKKSRLPPPHLNEIQKAIRASILQQKSVRFYLGFLIITGQEWSAQDFTLGDISHTIGLAPGQSKRIATVRWNRYKQTKRVEDTEVRETLDSEVFMEQSAEEQIHDLTIEKTRDADTEFKASYEQESKGVGGGFGTGSGAGASAALQYGTLGLAGAANSAFAGGISGNKVTTKGSQEGYIREDVTESTNLSGKITSDISNYTKQSAASVRSLRSTVVLEDAESDHESVSTTVLANYNHSHALNIQCYELLRRFGIFTKTDTVTPIIYIPIQPLHFDFTLVVRTWDILRPVLALYDQNSFQKWDTAIRNAAPVTRAIPNAHNTKIKSLIVENPFQEQLLLKFKLNDIPAPIVFDIPPKSSEHKIEVPVAPASIKKISLEGGNNGFLSIFPSVTQSTMEVMRILLILEDEDGTVIRVPYMMDVFRKKSIIFSFYFYTIEGQHSDFADMVEYYLHARYMAYQADITQLIEHLNTHALAYTRHLLLTSNPADLETCLEQTYLFYGNNRIPLAELADITKLLGITGTHLIYPLKRYVSSECIEQIAQGKISGLIYFQKTGEYRIESTDVRLVHNKRAKTIILEFEVNGFPYGSDPNEESVINVKVTYSKENGPGSAGGTMNVSNCQPDGEIEEFDLRGNLNSQNILKGTFAGDAESRFTTFYIKAMQWETVLVSEVKDTADGLETEIGKVWEAAEKLEREDAGKYDFIDLPSDGLFWEAVLGISNASEYVDPRRFTAWHEWPIPLAATEIGQIEMGRHQPTDATGAVAPTVPDSTLKQVTPGWIQPFTALSQIIGSLVSAPGVKGNADSLLGISSNLSELAKAAGQQASGLTGTLAATYMSAAVEFGKQVADMTNTAMGTLKGGGTGSKAAPPNSQTEKAGALNVLDEIGGSSQGPGGGDQDASSPPPGESKITDDKVDEAKANVVGASLIGDDSGSGDSGDTTAGSGGTTPGAINAGNTDVEMPPECSLNINAADAAKDSNFISGSLLEIPYAFSGTPPADNTYGIDVVSDQTANDKMKTGAPTDLSIDKPNKKIKFKPSHTGSSIDGTSAKPTGLKYKITFKVNNETINEITIEQDDVNTARQEYKVNGLPVPERNDFKTVEEALHKGTTSTHYPKTAFLDRRITTIHDKIKAHYPNVAYTCTWRNPYFNKSLGSPTTSSSLSDHCKGKAVDCKPAGAAQTAQNFKDQWDTIKTCADVVLLEKNSTILRSSGSGWKKLVEGDPHYSAAAADRTWAYIPDGSTIEIGYQNATHYHLDDRNQ